MHPSRILGQVNGGLVIVWDLRNPGPEICANQVDRLQEIRPTQIYSSSNRHFIGLDPSVRSDLLALAENWNPSD